MSISDIDQAIDLSNSRSVLSSTLSSTDDEGQPVHEFCYRQETVQTGKSKGTIRIKVKLVLYPYDFTKQTTRKDKVYFCCTPCRQLGHWVLANEMS